MILFKSKTDLRQWLDVHRKQHKSIGVVPTMGALHKGHLHLIEISKKVADITVCTIFINPTQFNDPSDFEKYPVSTEKDIEMLEKANADVLFLPSVQEIYPEGSKNLETYNLGYLESILEGKYRPGHFQGVCRVMNRLLTILQPDHLVMGQKDFQQCMVVKRLIQIMKITLQFHEVPTVREVDGLALSSRNRRLNALQRENSAAIYQSLNLIKKNLNTGDLRSLIDGAKNTLNAAQFKVDYVSVADAENLKLIDLWDGEKKLVALIAAFQGDIRLIDNMLLN